MSTTTVNGISIGYDDEGAGEPLVLVHGHPFDRSMWAPQAAEFGRGGHRVIVPDLRGFGESTVTPGAVPWKTYANDIAALLDELKIEEIVLGGLSMGGQIVLEFYRLFPGRVRALVLAATFAQLDTEAKKRWRYESADRLAGEGMAGFARESLPGMVAPGSPAAAERVLAMMNAAPPLGAAAALRSRAERPDYTGLLKTITVPALVVVGDQDELTPIADAEFMAGRIPGATLAVIEGAAHLPNLERPEAFNSTLRGFLDKQP